MPRHPRDGVHARTMQYNFEWDPAKAQANLRKHGVSFQEATEVFLDPLQLSIPDAGHSEEEERWITLGACSDQRLRLVVHTYVEYRDNQATIRIISARRATRHEQRHYEEAQ